MRVIVIGCGEVGQHIARTLSAERHDVTVVDADGARVEAMQDELDALVVAGNGASPQFLRELGARGADLLCAVTHSDEVNVAAAVHEFGDARIAQHMRRQLKPRGRRDLDFAGRDFKRHLKLERGLGAELGEPRAGSLLRGSAASPLPSVENG
ncbi:MAG: NAD-binding protein [Solirubrobacteraceae bacterium]